MTQLRSVAILALVLTVSAVCFAQDGFVDGVDLTTIKAPWTIRILGNDLDITNVQAKPDQASAYFMMVSESSKLNVSVFIEPVEKCKTSEECRDYVLNLGNPAWGKYEQLTKGRLKDFSYFEFYRPEAQGKPLKMLDMYAEHVSQGYWIDLHISKALYTKEDHVLFEKVVNSIDLIPQGGASKTPFDTQLVKAQNTTASWLSLWESMKCHESWTALSPITQADNPEKGWIEYCGKVNGYLGAKQSRNLIAAAFTSSLGTKTDRPVAILAYHSNFANRTSFIEITGLLLEKGGSWVMTNYLPQ